MSSHPRRPPASSQPGSDLDSTAELPVLYVPAPDVTTTTTTTNVPAPGTEDPLATTGTWVHPLAEQTASSAAAASAEEQRRRQLELESRTTALREAEERLASHAKRLLQLEQARDEALASQAAAAQRAASAEQRAASAEQRTASDEQRLAKLEQRAARLSAELSQRQAAAAQNAARLEESARALAAAEQRAAAASDDLAQARAVVSASGARTEELQQRLEQQENAVHTQRTRELEQQTLAIAGREHADGLMVDLHNERARAMSYLESLQTLEQRREIAQHLVTELHHEAEGRAAELARLTRELASRDELAQHQEEALAQRAGRIAQLEKQVSTLTTMITQRDAQLQDQDHQTEGLRSSLEAWLTAEQQRAAQLEGELATVRGEMEERGSVLRSAQQERGGHLASIAAAESRVRELEQAAAAREERVRALEAECATHGARLRGLEKELHAEELVQRLESDTRNRGPRIMELEASGAARPAVTDIHPAPREPARHAEEEAPGEEPMPDGATRLLIHSADGREVVHVLGRKTSIGRTPDNDLQLDAKSISRHHAVILVGQVSAVIEDLNSTNGVHVNGRRVIRQTLRDGDQIAIGRTHYRFVVRQAADKR